MDGTLIKVNDLVNVTRRKLSTLLEGIVKNEFSDGFDVVCISNELFVILLCL